MKSSEVHALSKFTRALNRRVYRGFPNSDTVIVEVTSTHKDNVKTHKFICKNTQCFKSFFKENEFSSVIGIRYKGTTRIFKINSLDSRLESIKVFYGFKDSFKLNYEYIQDKQGVFTSAN